MIKRIIKKKIKKAVGELAVDLFKLVKFVVQNTSVSYNKNSGEISIESKVKKEF